MSNIKLILFNFLISLMKKIYGFFLTFIILLFVIFTYDLHNGKITENIKNKKIVIIIGSDIEELSQLFNPTDYLVITKINFDTETIIKNNGLDIFINTWKTSTNSDLDHQIELNGKNPIKIIDHIVQFIKPGGKVINMSPYVNKTNSNSLVIPLINNYFKQKSQEYYDKTIGFSTINIDSNYSSYIINFIVESNWNVLTGREFYSSKINGKQIGYNLDIANTDFDTNTLNKLIVTNVFNGESVVNPNIKELDLTVYSNNQNILINALGQIHNVDTQFIKFHTGIINFLEKMIGVFVPVHHQIISSQMGYFNYICRDRITINISPIIKNKYAIPDYNKILDHINSLTRMIYLIAPLEKIPFDEFIKKVPYNIPILIDFCYDGFIVNPSNIKMQDYLNGANTIICINSFSKFNGLPGIHLSYSITKKDIGTIISNYFHYPVNLFYEKLALQVLDNKYLDSVRKYYDGERNKLIKILEKNNINYWFEFPNTLVIEKLTNAKSNKFSDESTINEYLAQTKLIHYYRISKENQTIQIKLFISTATNNDQLINKIVSIL